jgi:hypothetical protein
MRFRILGWHLEPAAMAASKAGRPGYRSGRIQSWRRASRTTRSGNANTMCTFPGGSVCTRNTVVFRPLVPVVTVVRFPASFFFRYGTPGKPCRVPPWAYATRPTMTITGAALMSLLLAIPGFARDSAMNGTWTMVPAKSDFAGQPVAQTGTVTINDRQGHRHGLAQFRVRRRQQDPLSTAT